MAKADELELDVAAKPKSGRLIWVLGGLGLLLVGVAIALTLYLTGVIGKANTDTPKTQGGTPVVVKPALYLPLDPAFVNFEDQSNARFLQVEIQVMARDQATLDAVQRSAPVIRNNILLLLSSQKYDVVSTREGKEKLRGEILAAINKALHDGGSKDKVEAVYFTSFVMQ